MRLATVLLGLTLLSASALAQSVWYADDLCSSADFASALEELSARDREILALRHNKGLSYREIAEGLGIPQGTVMSRLFHARRRLRERLAPTLEAMPDAAGTEIEALGGSES